MFGAYTQCKWPKSEGAVVADPSGQSFLFSLTNKSGRAARFSLRRKDEAVMLHFSSGVHFGWQTSFALLSQGKAAGDAGGNAAFALDARSSYQPDDKGVWCGDDFFAGSKDFAAADIEVYEL